MSKIQLMGSGAYDVFATTKKVFFRPSTPGDTVRVGQLVCYNSDIEADHKERTVDPSHLGLTQDTYAEGEQEFTGRLFIVEKPTAANVRQFAGVIKSLGSNDGADGDMLEIWTLNGGVVPVWVDATCVLDKTIIGVLPGSYNGAAHLLDGSNYVQNKDEDSPLAIGIAMESIDRDTINGLVWVRLFDEVGISPYTAYFAPVRSTSTLRGYAMGINIDGTKLLRGTTISKSYVVNIFGDKEEAYPATGDSNDAMLKISGSNYAVNDTNFIFRGLNCNVANRDPGELNLLTNNISVSLKSGSTTLTAIGLQVDCQHQAGTDNPTELGGLDVSLNFEGGEATEEYGIKVRTRGSVNVKVDSVFIIEKGTDYGFTNLFTFDAAATVSMTSSDGGVSTHKIPILDGSTTRYIMVSDG